MLNIVPDERDIHGQLAAKMVSSAEVSEWSDTWTVSLIYSCQEYFFVKIHLITA